MEYRVGTPARVSRRRSPFKPAGLCVSLCLVWKPDCCVKASRCWGCGDEFPKSDQSPLRADLLGLLGTSMAPCAPVDMVPNLRFIYSHVDRLKPVRIQ